MHLILIDTVREVSIELYTYVYYWNCSFQWCWTELHYTEVVFKMFYKREEGKHEKYEWNAVQYKNHWKLQPR